MAKIKIVLIATVSLDAGWLEPSGSPRFLCLAHAVDKNRWLTYIYDSETKTTDLLGNSSTLKGGVEGFEGMRNHHRIPTVWVRYPYSKTEEEFPTLNG